MIEQGPRLVLLGRQGAGKGTQSTRLAERYGVERVSTGELFRAAVAAGAPTGRTVAEYLDSGELVPDDIVLRLVDEHFRPGGPLERGFILDGFPRTVPQAEELEAVLDGDPLDLVINLDVPIDEVLHRLAGRRVCESCGVTYHVKLPPKHDWTCDICGGKVTQRPDDTEEAVSRRLELYEQETVPLISFYRSLERLVVIDAVGTGDDVFDRLVNAVDAALSLRAR